MSKCDFQIVFDREDRIYRPGDLIRGTVHLQVLSDFTCNRLVVEQFWRAHGRGNTAEGPRTTIVLPETAFRAGESRDFPFEFDAPDGPPTYHGKYLNVDQYVAVRAEISWAVDPKQQEDYLLLPGNRDWQNRPIAAPGRSRSGKAGSAIVTALGTGIIIAGLLTFCVFGFILVAIGAVLIWVGLSKAVAQHRVGDVALVWDSLQVPPGSRFPLRIRFLPRKSFAINAIQCHVVGTETCVSGSGTDKTTHTHVLHRQATVVASDISARAQEPLEFAAELEIPETTAYSFEATDNKLTWTVEVRIDIPKWPDWSDTITLVVRPKPTPSPSNVPLDVRPLAVEPRVREPLAVEPLAVALPPVESLAEVSLNHLARQLAEMPRYGPDREKLIKEHVGETFGCEVEVSSIERTFGTVPDAYRNGRTIVGQLAGTECKLAVSMCAARNEEIERLIPGERFPVQATLVKWNVIYDRLEMHEGVS